MSSNHEENREEAGESSAHSNGGNKDGLQIPQRCVLPRFRLLKNHVAIWWKKNVFNLYVLKLSSDSEVNHSLSMNHVFQKMEFCSILEEFIYVISFDKQFVTADTLCFTW